LRRYLAPYDLREEECRPETCWMKGGGWRGEAGGREPAGIIEEADNTEERGDRTEARRDREEVMVGYSTERLNNT